MLVLSKQKSKWINEQLLPYYPSCTDPSWLWCLLERGIDMYSSEMHGSMTCLGHLSLVPKWWLIPCRPGFLGRFMVSSCMLVGGCWVQFLMQTPYCPLDRRGFRLRMILMLLCSFCHQCLSFAASCLSASNLWLMSANCLALRPPAAMTDAMADSRLCKWLLFSWSL